RLRVRRLPAGAPLGPDRVPVPGDRAPPQGGRVGGARPHPAAGPGREDRLITRGSVRLVAALGADPMVLTNRWEQPSSRAGDDLRYATPATAARGSKMPSWTSMPS